MASPDIYRSAHLLIQQHGPHAMLLAITRVYEMADSGDDAGLSTWLGILNAAEELQDTRRRTCDMLH